MGRSQQISLTAILRSLGLYNRPLSLIFFLSFNILFESIFQRGVLSMASELRLHLCRFTFLLLLCRLAAETAPPPLCGGVVKVEEANTSGRRHGDFREDGTFTLVRFPGGIELKALQDRGERMGGKRGADAFRSPLREIRPLTRDVRNISSHQNAPHSAPVHGFPAAHDG